MKNCKWIVAVVVFCIFSMAVVIIGNGTIAGDSLGANRQEAITITWFVADSGYSKIWNPEKNKGDAKILKNTGVHLDIKSGSLTDLDALISTDSLPDLITVDANASERLLLENSGMVQALEPLFKTYAPDINIPDSMKEWYRNENGNWYAIASYYYGPERVNEKYGGYLGTHNYNYVRNDLLGQTDILKEELETKEGLLKALRAAKFMKYQGQQVIPYSGWWTQNIAEQFGMRVEDEEGNFLFRYRQPEWLEALQFGNQLYREGLMLPEEFTESVGQRRKQVEAGRIFFCTGYANIQEAKDILAGKDKKAFMEYAGHIRGESGSRPNLKSVPSGGWTVTMISKNAAHKDRIVEFISYMTGEEATLDAAPLIGAETYKIKNGRRVMKESVRQEFEEDYGQAAEKYFLDLEFFVDWTIVQKYQSNEERMMFRKQYKDCNIYDSKAADAAYIVNSSNKMFDIKVKTEAYYNNAEVDILTSNSMEQCTKKYNQVIEAMEGMGLKELEAYEQGQYQRAKEKMAVIY